MHYEHHQMMSCNCVNKSRNHNYYIIFVRDDQSNRLLAWFLPFFLRISNIIDLAEWPSTATVHRQSAPHLPLTRPSLSLKNEPSSDWSPNTKTVQPRMYGYVC